MYLVKPRAQAVDRPLVHRDGIEIGHLIYLGSLEVNQRGPQAFTVSTPPGYVLNAHFHDCDQFQIFVAGSPRVGRREVVPVTVQYADSYTTYGPYHVGAEGMTFFNFRAYSDIAANPMPASKGSSPRGRGRLIDAPTRLRFDGSMAPGMLHRATLIEAADDGLAAYEILAGPHTDLPEQTVGGSARFVLVLGGEVAMGTERLDAEGVGYVSPGDRTPAMRTGVAGVHLLDLQLPVL